MKSFKTSHILELCAGLTENADKADRKAGAPRKKNWLMILLLFLAGVILVFVILVFDHREFEMNRKRRRDYYRDEYLKSDEWKRKRYVVLKRDNWRCVYCGAPATQVHHLKYARKNIGKEPIEWLVSICKPCHDSKHN